MTPVSGRRRTAAAGFSLLEVMVSMLLLTIASMALLQSLGLTFQVIKRTRAMRTEALDQWNQVQRWRASIDGSPAPDVEGPLTVHKAQWQGSPSGVLPVEALHGDR